MRPPALLTLALLLPCACASALAQSSAEPSGCPAEQLEISDAHQPLEGPSWWTATCRPPGAEPTQWFCSQAGRLTEVVCTDVPPKR